MTHRIRRICVLQAAKMFAVLYFIMGLVFVPFFLLVAKAVPSEAPFPFSGVLLFLLPVLYGCLGFVATAIMAAFYNLVSGWIGGIEIELTDASAT